MTDVVNGYFRRFYPPDLDRNDPGQWRYTGIGWEFVGDAETIFPMMLCADGFSMSVQGHYGAYSEPRDDFAEAYEEVEIALYDGLNDALLDGLRSEVVGNDMVIYPWLAIGVVAAIVKRHGGLFDWNAADLGPLP